jgi:proliferating cell nuclear antigen
MFEAKLERASLFKRVIDALRDLQKEVNFECNEKGMHLRMMDSSHVSLVDLVILESAFVSYRADRPKVLGMSLADLGKVFKLCGNDDSMTLRCDDTADSVQFLFENQSGDQTCTYDLKLLDLEQETLGVPDGSCKCTVTMPAANFAKIARDFKEFSDSIKVSSSKEGLEFAQTSDFGTGKINIKPRDSEKEEDRVEIKCVEPTSADYSIRYLNFFTKATPLSSRVTLRISDDAPIQLVYDLESSSCGFISYYLAPKIEQDDM